MVLGTGTSSHRFDIRTAYAPFASSLPEHTSIYHEWPRHNLRTNLPDYINVATSVTTDLREVKHIESSYTLMGKPIHVSEGDRLEVSLNNYLPTTGLSLHFHGFEMRDSLVYDGVVGITQCAVSPYETFVYNFTVDEVPGTYWYHTHAGFLGVDGYNAIKGPLIVHPRHSPNLLELSETNRNEIAGSHSSLISYGNERILFFSDGSLLSESSLYMNQLGGLNPPISKNDDGFTVGTIDYHFGTCNGKLREVVHVFPGETYKFRVLNGGSHFAFRIHIDDFAMKVIAADSELLEPLEVDEIILHAGERFDVEITIPTDFEGGERFWIRADTVESSKQGYQNGVRAILNVLAPGSTYPFSTDSDVPDPLKDIVSSSKRLEDRKTVNCYSRHEMKTATHQGGCLPITDLKSAGLPSNWDSIKHSTSSVPEVHYADFEFSPYPLHAHFVRIDDGLYIQHENPSKAMIHPTFESTLDFHQNTAMMNVSAHSTVIIIWRNKSLMDHPMHLHGYKMEILKIEMPTRDEDCTLSKCKLNTAFDLKDSEVFRSLERAPIGSGVLKDTFILPAGGAVATRIHTNEPALWFAHCHLDTHKSDGMAFVLNVGNYHSETNAMWIPDDYPSCDTPFLKTKHEYPSCHCYVNEDAVLDTALTKDHRCSRDHLCHYQQSKAANLDSYKSSGFRITSQYLIPNWAIAAVMVSIIVVATVTISRLSRSDNEVPSTICNNSKLRQLRHNVRKEWQSYRPGCINPLRVFEVTGLATLTGYLFYDVGNNPTATGLSEKYSLLFFSITLWTFTRMYPAVPNYRAWLNNLQSTCDEFTTGSDLAILCITRCIVVFGNEAWWPMIYCFVCFPLAGMFRHIFSVIIIGIFLALNTLCYVALGGALGVSFDFVPLGMSMSTIISQTTLVAAGFYTQLPLSLSWIRYLSPVFWTYRGILKTALRWSDTYTCVRGQTDVGTNECYLEFNPGIDALKRRGLNVASFNNKQHNGVAVELLALFVLFLALQLYTFFSVYVSTARNSRSGTLCNERSTSSHESSGDHSDTYTSNDAGRSTESTNGAGVEAVELVA
eukprot:CAMPEP_0172386058 /NCGR_PEP_ID=MMETSP1061-20121228/3655_1 /TAXON_ID=37318 /ORGANISM="Pseudo-nitzschia pungens, Strain cf. pungens" /LENGTH=1062 /DNA_ID=CAMNT_0013115305 /DNA_START=282 /DNA_END=3470 /DNA_ORIENTATION=-